MIRVLVVLPASCVTATNLFNVSLPLPSCVKSGYKQHTAYKAIVKIKGVNLAHVSYVEQCLADWRHS